MEKALKRKGNNPLLAKDDVGKCKPCSFRLPTDGFAYGKPDMKDPEGAREVLSSWAYHEQSKVSSSKKDFKNMNKFGITKGAINSKAQNDLRKKKDLRVSQEPKHNLNKKTELPNDMIYGIMNRPSTPIEGVISNTYGQHAEHEAEQIYKESSRRPAQKNKPSGVRQTKATQKLIEHQQHKLEDRANDKTDNFKIKRFAKVGSRVQGHVNNKNKAVSRAPNPEEQKDQAE